MFKFVIKRILLMIPVMLGVLIIVFLISRISGDPVTAILGTGATGEAYAELEHALGLDQSLPKQFLDYLVGIVTQFDLGISYITTVSVKHEILSRLPVSLEVAFISLAISIIIGVPFGVLCAVNHNRIIDYILSVLSLILASMPSFWVALLLIIKLSLDMGWFPATGLESFSSWVLPCVSLGLSGIASLCRTTRANMLEVVRQDYIRTARSKGVSENRVIYRHALKNAIIPVITIIGVLVGVNIGNAIVIETVFNIQGLGTYMSNAISANDYPAIQGSVLVFAFVVCIVNLLTDIAYGFVDPRIKAQYVRGGGKKLRKLLDGQPQAKQEVA